MEGSHWPLILIEGVLVFGGALAFGWWQLRSVRKDREKSQQQKRDSAALESTGHPEGQHHSDRP